MTRGKRILVAAAMAAGLAGCDEDRPAGEPATEYITVRRAWRAGERDSIIAATIAGRLLVLPFVGDLSDQIGLLLHPDSTSDLMLNPAYLQPSSVSPLGPAFALLSQSVPGNGWTTYGVDVRMVNNNPGEPDYDWLGVYWYQDNEPTRKGLLLAATANTTYPTTVVNTDAFTASGNTAGVGGGEQRASNVTYWEADGGSTPNTFRVVSMVPVGTPQTVTTGPFLGGTVRGGIMNVTLNTIRLTRALGAGNPATLTVNFSGTINALEFTCIFPNPCTTNTLRAEP